MFLIRAFLLIRSLNTAILQFWNSYLSSFNLLFFYTLRISIILFMFTFKFSLKRLATKIFFCLFWGVLGLSWHTFSIILVNLTFSHLFFETRKFFWIYDNSFLPLCYRHCGASYDFAKIRFSTDASNSEIVRPRYSK